MNANFEDVQPIGKQNLVDIKGSNIPLPSYVYDSASGRISFAANLAAARRQGLGLSARLLNLATEVRQ